jgi:hypothetical protein
MFSIQIMNKEKNKILLLIVMIGYKLYDIKNKYSFWYWSFW